jgi:hypothetical protein
MTEPTTVLLPVVAGADLPRQAYSHGPEHDPEWTRPENFRPITNKRRRWVKPDPGTGFWTATVTEETADGNPARTSWTEWCDGEQFGTYTHLVEVIPHPAARVIRIATLAALCSVVAAFPTEPLFDGASIYPDWAALARDWDAVWLTDEGQWATRLPPVSSPDLYGWDCESVLFLRPAYTVGETHICRSWRTGDARS